MKLRVINSKNDQGRVFSFENAGEIVLGRSSTCQVCLNDVECSRNHARILFSGGKTLLEDLSSKNGTFLNGRTVFKSALTNGDEILLGASLLTVSELPAVRASETTSLRSGESRARVVIALPQGEADLLAGKTISISLAEMEHENRILREVCRISQLAASKTDRQTILQTVLDEMRSLLAADTACLLARGEGEEEWAVMACAGGGAGDLHVSHTIIRQALDEGKAILSTDPMSDDRFDASQSIVSAGVSSAMCSPVRLGRGQLGVLFLDRRNRQEAFAPMDLRLSASAANILGVFLEKEEFEAEVQSKARLAAVGEVMASLAHYIKNVITGLRLTIATLRTIISQQRMDKVGQYLDMLSDQERRISDLMLNMLTYVKDRQPVRQPVKLADLVRGVVEPLRPKLEESGIRFELVCDDRTTELRGEEMALHRVLLNLILNTLDAFESKPGAREKLIRLTVAPLPEGEGAELRFYDTACGIPKDKLRKIFSAFYSTKGSRGTGLGLAVVEKLVREHGGSVTVTSAEGEWTEFRFTIRWGGAPAQPAAGNQVSSG
jgi:two-component system, NtrC family, sensor kinase